MSPPERGAGVAVAEGGVAAEGIAVAAPVAEGLKAVAFAELVTDSGVDIAEGGLSARVGTAFRQQFHHPVGICRPAS